MFYADLERKQVYLAIDFSLIFFTQKKKIKKYCFAAALTPAQIVYVGTGIQILPFPGIIIPGKVFRKLVSEVKTFKTNFLNGVHFNFPSPLPAFANKEQF